MALEKAVTETHTLHYPKGLIKPEDFANFVQFPRFRRRWDDLRLSELDLDAAKILIMLGPDRAPVIKHTGGLRKIRFSPPKWNTGKRGALRIVYAYSESRSIVLLVTVYSKHDEADIPMSERAIIKMLLREAWARV